MITVVYICAADLSVFFISSELPFPYPNPLLPIFHLLSLHSSSASVASDFHFSDKTIAKAKWKLQEAKFIQFYGLGRYLGNVWEE